MIVEVAEEIICHICVAGEIQLLKHKRLEELFLMSLDKQ